MGLEASSPKSSHPFCMEDNGMPKLQSHETASKPWTCCWLVSCQPAATLHTSEQVWTPVELPQLGHLADLDFSLLIGPCEGHWNLCAIVMAGCGGEVFSLL